MHRDAWLRMLRCGFAVGLIVLGLIVLGGSAEGASPGGASSEGASSEGASSEAGDDRAAAERGYRLLTEVSLLPPDFTQEVFDDVWQVWPEPLRSQAKSASVEERRRMVFRRYGLTPRPGDDSSRPLQYVVDEAGNWTMNCLACHGGQVLGNPYPGAPNNRFALQTLTEEIRQTKLRKGVSLSRMDIGSLIIPLGTTHGTTNAVVFGQGLMHHRDEDLNVVDRPPASFTHHDMDAPPWWHFHKKTSLYIDGFAAKGHRGLMQFMLVPENGPDFFREREDDFRDVFAYLSSIRPPAYPEAIDDDLAEQGRGIFLESCAECHGTYGPGGDYPNRRVAWDEIRTDPVRLRSLSVQGRRKYAESWFAHAGEPEQQATLVDPDGYVAPPLDGIWASPPYFHNGSVPTLWHVLTPADRPEVWRPIGAGMDWRKVGWPIEVVGRVPWEEPDIAVRRSYFDTRRRGKGNAGHDFGEALSPKERWAVLEYLKTL